MEQGVFVFHATASPNAPSKRGTRWNKRSSPIQATGRTTRKTAKADSETHEKLQLVREQDLAPGSQTDPLSLKDIQPAASAFSVLIDKVVQYEKQLKVDAVTEVKDLRNKNHQLLRHGEAQKSHLQSMEKTSESLRQMLDEKTGEIRELRTQNQQLMSTAATQGQLVQDMEQLLADHQAKIVATTAELSNLKDDALAKEDEAEAVRVALERKFLELKDKLADENRNNEALRTQLHEVGKQAEIYEAKKLEFRQHALNYFSI
ncbi:hypothetical protein C8R44DRAFT_792810 [Mycena epipterygia]|nr:hypothetical protein C8R44DRAFT_792810 [Mycena epipterygia]